VDDPSDRRAKLVVYTDRGRKGFAASRTIIADLEADAERQLGRTRYAHLREGLAILGRSRTVSGDGG
jgi:DNA-binding MarR family transcriptional regulator